MCVFTQEHGMLEYLLLFQLDACSHLQTLLIHEHHAVLCGVWIIRLVPAASIGLLPACIRSACVAPLPKKSDCPLGCPGPCDPQVILGLGAVTAGVVLVQTYLMPRATAFVSRWWEAACERQQRAERRDKEAAAVLVALQAMQVCKRWQVP